MGGDAHDPLGLQRTPAGGGSHRDLQLSPGSLPALSDAIPRCLRQESERPPVEHMAYVNTTCSHQSGVELLWRVSPIVPHKFVPGPKSLRTCGGRHDGGPPRSDSPDPLRERAEVIVNMLDDLEGAHQIELFEVVDQFWTAEDDTTTDGRDPLMGNSKRSWVCLDAEVVGSLGDSGTERPLATPDLQDPARPEVSQDVSNDRPTKLCEGPKRRVKKHWPVPRFQSRWVNERTTLPAPKVDHLHRSGCRPVGFGEFPPSVDGPDHDARRRAGGPARSHEHLVGCAACLEESGVVRHCAGPASGRATQGTPHTCAFRLHGPYRLPAVTARP